ncbi:MAG: hypothetical protein Q9209_004843 [Squamulea sp. 1 TL-2023]
MAALSARQVFQPSCPQGGSWTVCESGSRFVGCCLNASAACVNGCSDEDLKPASFLKERYLDVTASLCPGGSHWYTCATITPTFMGCCVSNPCAQKGCPRSDLRAAVLSPFEEESGPYTAIPGPSTTNTSSSSQPSSLASSTVSAAASSSTTASGPTSTTHKNIGALIGGIVGGVIAISLLALLIFLLIRRRRQRHNSTTTTLPNHKDASSGPFEKDTSTVSIPGYNSSSFSSPLQELETPPPDPWHIPSGKAYEMPCPDLGSDKQGVQGKGEGLGIYSHYKAVDGQNVGKPGLYDERRNISYELDGRGTDNRGGV